MSLTFERGDPDRPRGHAIVYFRVSGPTERIVATYVVTLPLQVDFTRYLPPLLASQMGALPVQDLSGFAMPPVPDDAPPLEELRRLADLRGDDLLFGGALLALDLPGMMSAVNDAVQDYAAHWRSYAERTRAPAPAGREREGPAESDYGVNEVLYGLMSERDRLTELSRLLGKLRFAAESRDARLASEAEEEIRAIGKHLRGDYRLDKLLAAAREPTARGSRLAQLYLERAFKLCDQDFNAMRDVDRRIQELESQPQEG